MFAEVSARLFSGVVVMKSCCGVWGGRGAGLGSPRLAAQLVAGSNCTFGASAHKGEGLQFA